MSSRSGRRVIAQQWFSVDGFASGPTDEAEIFAAVPEATDRASMGYNETPISDVETVLLGRRYESFVAHLRFAVTDART